MRDRDGRATTTRRWQVPEAHPGDDAGAFDLVWGIKPTFVRYLRSIPDLEIRTSHGAEPFGDGGHWRFPGAGGETVGDPWDGGTARFEFGGELRIEGHHGAMRVVLARPRIEVAAGVAELSVLDPADDAADGARVVLATGPVDPSRRRGDGSAAFDLDLADAAVPVFNGVYAAGTPLAPAVLVPRGA